MYSSAAASQPFMNKELIIFHKWQGTGWMFSISLFFELEGQEHLAEVISVKDLQEVVSKTYIHVCSKLVIKLSLSGCTQNPTLNTMWKPWQGREIRVKDFPARSIWQQWKQFFNFWFYQAWLRAAFKTATCQLRSCTSSLAVLSCTTRCITQRQILIAGIPARHATQAQTPLGKISVLSVTMSGLADSLTSYIPTCSYKVMDKSEIHMQVKKKHTGQFQRGILISDFYKQSDASHGLWHVDGES